MKYIIMITLAFLFFECSERTEMQENEKRITESTWKKGQRHLYLI